jgi:hypothetical protein
MLPHPDTARRIMELRDQERLRDVAQQRRAADPKVRACSRTTRSWSTGLAPASWFRGWVAGVCGATRGHGTSALEHGVARSAPHVG